MSVSVDLPDTPPILHPALQLDKGCLAHTKGELSKRTEFDKGPILTHWYCQGKMLVICFTIFYNAFNF